MKKADAAKGIACITNIFSSDQLFNLFCKKTFLTWPVTEANWAFINEAMYKFHRELLDRVIEIKQIHQRYITFMSSNSKPFYLYVKPTLRIG